MPALWTMMSASRAASSVVDVRRPASGAVTSVQSGSAEPVRAVRQALSGRRDVDADDGRPVASEHPAIDAPIPEWRR
jgi:hypothetical protein